MKKIEALNKILDYIKTDNSLEINDVLDKLGNTHIEIVRDHKCYLKELTWKEGLKIDAQSFKSNGKNLYFSSENEKRQILKLAIIRIEDENDNIVDFNFEDLSHSFLEELWAIYQKYLHLTANEIDFIYQSSKKYFDPNNQDVFPLHPIIVEVDYMTKGIVNYSRDEFNKLTIKEFEAIQLILATKNEI